MATDMFLFLEGIRGESLDKQFPETVELSSVSYGMSIPGSLKDPADGSSVELDQIVVSKRVDRASLPLLKALAEGTTPVRRARIVMRKPLPDRPYPQPFLVIELEGVRVRGVEVQTNRGDEDPTEQVTLAFERIVWTYGSMVYAYQVSAPA